MSLLSASCDRSGLIDLHHDQPITRLSRYWDRLERQLRRPVQPVDDGLPPVYEQDGSPVEVPEYSSDLDGHDQQYQCETDLPTEYDPSRRAYYRTSLTDIPDSRYDPGHMTPEDFASLTEAEIWADSQVVIDWLRRFVREKWRLNDLMPGAERIAYSRLPVSGTAERYTMPAPCHYGSGANRLGDSTRYAVPSVRDLTTYLRFLASRLDLETASLGS